VTSRPLLEFDAVTAGYATLTVLDGVTLKLERDEVLALLGANGSGKSTVVKTAIGLTRVTGGAVRFEGADITKLAPHRRAGLGIGYVPQTHNVFAELSVLENLRMGGFLHAASLRSGIDEVFDLFPGLRDRQRIRAHDLSGGERRMLSIGLTLLLRPRLLLLDEPSSDLSPSMVAVVFDAIRRIRGESRIPVLLVEQNVRMALSIADRVCVMVRGRQAFDAPSGDIDMAHLHSLFIDGSVGTG
jgi:ABC-type branched-subunit amino acid transport system ATPase component